MLGPSELLTDLSMGHLHVVDLDDNGMADLVGGRGVLLFNAGNGFDAKPLPDFPETNASHPGRFGGGDGIDLVAAVSDEIHAFLDVAGRDIVTVVTPASNAWTYDTHDFDGDGIDDVLLLLEGGKTVDVWQGTATGEFVPSTSIPLRTPASWVQAASFEPPAVDIVVSHDGTIRRFVAEGATFQEADVYDGSLGIFWMRRFTSPAGEALVYETFLDNGFEWWASVGVLSRSAGTWFEANHELPDGSLPVASPAVGDLDSDTDTDIVVVLATDEVVLEFVCAADDGGLTPCGSTPIQHTPEPPESVAVLPTARGPVIVYTTVDNGTWAAPVIQTPDCP